MVLLNNNVTNGGNLSDLVMGLEDYASGEELANVELFKNYPEALLWFAFVSCVLFMILGIPGNLLTIVALMRYKKVRIIFLYMQLTRIFNR